MEPLNDSIDLREDNSDWADFTPPAKRRRFTEPFSESQLLSAPKPWRNQSDPNQLGSYNNPNPSPISLKRRRGPSPFEDAFSNVQSRIITSNGVFSSIATAIPEDKRHPQSKFGPVNEGMVQEHFCENENEQSVATRTSDLVCFGVIDEIELETARRLSERSFRDGLEHRRYNSLRCLVDKTYGYISIHLSSGKFVGMLEKNIRSAIGEITRKCPIQLEAYIEVEKQEFNTQKLKILLKLNGSYSDATSVADVLYDYDIFLQRPDPEINDLPYKNPQELEIPSELLEQFQAMGLAQSNNSTVLRKVEVKDMLSELWKSDRGRIRLEPCRFTSHLETPLLPHQIEALSFLRAREEESNASERSFNYLSPSLGGLLADDMGLGKTLTTLALIASTVPTKTDGNKEPTRLPTLVVVTASTLTLWEEEIDRHFKANRIRWLIYHGPKRKSTSKTFHQHDIVLTTYDIVVQDWPSNTIHDVEWLRVVLDEAHLIRNHTTKRSKAVSALLTNRRWALTGTPIQNRLSDLGGILHFLRLNPYPTFASFSQNILKHLKNGDHSRLSMVHDLLQTMALRRTKNVLKSLPSREDFIEELEFGAEERRLYETCRRESIRRIDSVLDTNGSNPGGMSRVAGPKIMHCLLIQRQVCCHGVSLIPQEVRNRLRAAQDEEHVDTDPADTEVLNVECESCNSRFEPKQGNSFEFCFHLICDSCSGSVQARNCPICIPEEVAEQPKKGKGRGRETDEEWFDGIGYDGPSTKVLALTRNLETAMAETPPVKSVVFSCWTRMLCLIGHHLTSVGIKYLRIDGSMGIKDRKRILDEFKSGTEHLVLLMSIGTGSVGLNLSAASHVHLMEPQWNPMMESQALDRVYRLGQTRPVKTIRYIVKDTFERNMLELQEKKLLQITLALDASRAQAMRERLLDLKRIFS